ncbi:MAG: dephospho-CoA kinase [Candidatus Margulisbacteria bacterium]|nr:dephospho-CoA kinase [Candidatus Margulisiibacteriota bacterium]
MKIIGLTGPIGSGKDAVAKVLRRRGAVIINADKIAHTLYSTQSPVWHELVRVFGSKILNRGGKVNRKKLGEVVFSDKSKLLRLNRIIHPFLREAIIEMVENCKLLVVSCKLIVINAAVLREIGLINCVDEVWVVMSAKDKRLSRLLKQGLNRAEANARLRSQMSQREYLKIADVVIQNNGTLRGLAKKTIDLL